MTLAVEHQLPKSNEAPALARDLVRALEGAVPAELVDDVSLLVSELVSNGVRYGGDGQIMLHVAADPHTVRGEIVDQGAGFEPQTRADRTMALGDVGGWGLHLVEALADDWGVTEGHAHVWFELHRD